MILRTAIVCVIAATALSLADADAQTWERRDLRIRNSTQTFSTRGVYVAPDETVWVPLGGSFLARSTDAGDTWDTIRAGQQTYYESVYVNSAGHIFAGGSDNILRSTDNGATFSIVGASRCNVVDIVADKEGWMYAAAWGGDDGVYRSTDSGSTWTRTQFAEPPELSIVRCVGIGPDGAILACTKRGLYISNDRGNTYRKAVDSSILDEPYDVQTSPNGSIFMTTSRGMFRSRDSAKTWERKTPLSYQMLNVCIDRFGAIFACAYKAGVWCSRDNGESWARIDGGASLGANIIYLALAPSGRLFGTEHQPYIYRTVGPVSSVRMDLPLPNRMSID